MGNYAPLSDITVQSVAVSQRRTCRPPPQKWPHQKVIVNGAKCSESNGKDSEHFWIQARAEILNQQCRKLGWFFRKNDTKMVITRKIKIVEFWNLVLLSIQPIADILRKKIATKKKVFLILKKIHAGDHAFSKSNFFFFLIFFFPTIFLCQKTFFFSKSIFFCGWLRPPAPHTRAAPLDPACP